MFFEEISKLSDVEIDFDLVMSLSCIEPITFKQSGSYNDMWTNEVSAKTFRVIYWIGLLLKNLPDLIAPKKTSGVGMLLRENFSSI